MEKNHFNMKHIQVRWQILTENTKVKYVSGFFKSIKIRRRCKSFNGFKVGWEVMKNMRSFSSYWWTRWYESLLGLRLLPRDAGLEHTWH